MDVPAPFFPLAQEDQGAEMGEVRLMTDFLNFLRRRIEEEAGYRTINYITSLGIELRSFDDLIGPTFYMAR